MDCIVHGDAKSRTALRDFHFHHIPSSALHYLPQVILKILLQVGIDSATAHRSRGAEVKFLKKTLNIILAKKSKFKIMTIKLSFHGIKDLQLQDTIGYRSRR